MNTIELETTITNFTKLKSNVYKLCWKEATSFSEREFIKIYTKCQLMAMVNSIATNALIREYLLKEFEKGEVIQ